MRLIGDSYGNIASSVMWLRHECDTDRGPTVMTLKILTRASRGIGLKNEISAINLQVFGTATNNISREGRCRDFFPLGICYDNIETSEPG